MTLGGTKVVARYTVKSLEEDSEFSSKIKFSNSGSESLFSSGCCDL